MALLQARYGMIKAMKKAFLEFSAKATQLAFIGLVALYSPLCFAAEANKDSVQGYIVLILNFINFILIPLIFSIALLFFLINAARYFILEGAESEGREKAKMLALYGIGAFVFLVSIWGIVNMFVSGLGFDEDQVMCPDYMGSWCENYYGESVAGHGDSFKAGDDTSGWSVHLKFNL